MADISKEAIIAEYKKIIPALKNTIKLTEELLPALNEISFGDREEIKYYTKIYDKKEANEELPRPNDIIKFLPEKIDTLKSLQSLFKKLESGEALELSEKEKAITEMPWHEIAGFRHAVRGLDEVLELANTSKDEKMAKYDEIKAALKVILDDNHSWKLQVFGNKNHKTIPALIAQLGGPAAAGDVSVKSRASVIKPPGDCWTKG